MIDTIEGFFVSPPEVRSKIPANGLMEFPSSRHILSIREVKAESLGRGTFSAWMIFMMPEEYQLHECLISGNYRLSNTYVDITFSTPDPSLSWELRSTYEVSENKLLKLSGCVKRTGTDVILFNVELNRANPSREEEGDTLYERDEFI